MRKLKLQIQMTLDGFISSTNGEMDWINFNWTSDIKNYVDEITASVDTILLGKNLAIGFIPHWAAVAKDGNHPEQAAGVKFSTTQKIVFSKTLTRSVWKNTTVEHGDFIEKIKQLKKQAGKEMIAYGGSIFVSSLLREKLIDELHLFVNPVILGKGKPIFQEIHSMQKLDLIFSKQFACGIVVLVYQLA